MIDTLGERVGVAVVVPDPVSDAVWDWVAVGDWLVVAG